MAVGGKSWPTLPETNKSPLKDIFISQASVFRGYLSFRESKFLFTWSSHLLLYHLIIWGPYCFLGLFWQEFGLGIRPVPVCCTPRQLSWRDMQAPNSNHSAHSWWPRWNTGSQLQGKSQQNGRFIEGTGWPFCGKGMERHMLIERKRFFEQKLCWCKGIPNAKQYPVHQHTNTVFENLWDIMRYVPCQKEWQPRLLK